MDGDAFEVTRDADRHRYEIAVGGDRVGLATYRDHADVRTFDHTEIAPDHEGQGLAGHLIRKALDDARAEGRRVVPACSYVRAFIDRNPEYADLADA